MAAENQKDAQNKLEIISCRYVSAMDAGNIDVIAEIVEQSLENPELWAVIDGINNAYAEEEGL